jgi:hypothetical protein
LRSLRKKSIKGLRILLKRLIGRVKLNAELVRKKLNNIKRTQLVEKHRKEELEVTKEHLEDETKEDI